MDEAGKDEILEETGIIRVQLGYMRQEQGIEVYLPMLS